MQSVITANCQLSEFLLRINPDRRTLEEIAELVYSTLVNDGAEDAEGLRLADVLSIMTNNINAADAGLAFCLSEYLAYSLVLNLDMQSNQKLTTVFSICGLADFSRAGACDWSLQHHKAMAAIAILGIDIELDHMLYLLYYVFGRDGGQIGAGQAERLTGKSKNESKTP